MIDCVNIATEVFKDELEIPRQITLPKIEHGLHAPESVLKYPGKVFCHENLIFISDTSNHRLVQGIYLHSRFFFHLSLIASKA